MSEGVPEYAVPESESGFLPENAIYCSPLLTDKQTGRKRQSSTSPEDLRGEGGWPPPLSVVLTVTITHNKGGVSSHFRTDRGQADQAPISEGASGSR